MLQIACNLEEELHMPIIHTVRNSLRAQGCSE
jgi:hypothetical protein